MRYLFVSWDGGGNLVPELAVARALVGRGHHVGFLGHASQRQRIEAGGCSFRPFSRAPDCDASRRDGALVADWEDRPPEELFALAREHFLFGPAADFALDVVAELDRRPVDAVAVDYQIPGALAGVESTGTPAAALWHNRYEPPSWWGPGLPALNSVRARLGLGPLTQVFEQYDRLARVLVLTSPSFDFAPGSGVALPANVRYVGAQTQTQTQTQTQAQTRASAPGPPLILVSLGTTYQGQEDVLRRLVDALATLPARVLVTTGPAVGLEGPFPPNVEVSKWVPHVDILPLADLVVTHGGMGTVMAALAHGVPLVCIPLGRDQPANAARVVHSGAGVRLSRSASEAELTTAIGAALSDRRLAAAARRVARVLAREAPDQAVLELEAVASPST